MQQKEDINPKETADCFSLLLFTWVRKIIHLGHKRTLTKEDVYPILSSDYSSVLGSQLELNWFKHVEKCAQTNKKPSFRWTVFQTFGKHFLYYGLFTMLEECVFRMLQVVSLGYLIDYFSDAKPKLNTKSMAIMGCAGLVFSSFALSILFHWSLHCTHHVTTQMRLAVSSLIYRKTLRLSQATMRSFSVGQLITMLSSDAHRFDMQDLNLNHLWIAPVQLAIVIYLLYVHYDFGLASLGGLWLLVAFVVFQYIMGTYVSKVRLHKIVATHKKLKIVQEIMHAFYSIKLYGWEDVFMKKAKETRNDELKYIKKTMFLKILNLSLSLILTKMTIFFAILFYVYYDKALNSQRVFITLVLYEHVRMSMVNLFSKGVHDFAETSVTFVRMTEFLLLEEKHVDPSCYIVERNEDQGNNVAGSSKSPSPGVIMESVNCKWHPDQESNTLEDISLELTEGKLIAVVGPISSGKSSLLSALLGELPITQGKIKCKGQICYVSATPWLFPGTIRQNILFGNSYNPTWYKEVIDLCSLQPDLESMASGDQTKVIHSGLSVGQKARISLARAVYSNADIYLMDDPLNCVDGLLTKHILESCLKGALRKKAILLVTHQLQILEAADTIAIIMGGKIRAKGTYTDLVKSGIRFSNEVKEEDIQDVNEYASKRMSILVVEEEEETHRLVVKEVAPPIPTALEDLTPSSSLDNLSPFKAESSKFRISNLTEKDIEASDEVNDKTYQPGKIGIRLFWSYLKSSSSWILIITAIALGLLVQLIYTTSDIWLEVWIEDEEARATGIVHTHFRPISPAIYERDIEVIIYCLLIPSLVVATILRGIAMFRIGIKSSLTIFCQLLSSLLRSKANSVDTARSSGHGINRFSKDMIVIDEILPTTLYDITGVFFEIFGALVILALVNAWFLIPSLIFVVLSIYLFNLYQPSASSLKRLEADARSPVYAHTIKTLEGLTSIRAYEQEGVFLKIFDDLQDRHTANWNLYIGIHSWLGVYVGWVSFFLISSIAISFVVFDNSEAAEVGLAIAKVIELSILMQRAAVEAADCETEMIAVERILEYTHEESEAPWEKPDKKPPEDWPQGGHIVFENVVVEGFEGKELLKKFSCDIGAGEKVGIVGRSGAGKTIFINALFRITEPKSGTITIDDINILELGLHDLRRKLSVIPQVPHIFSGSLRMNLDPFKEFHDKELWDVLEEVNLFDTTKALGINLDTQFGELGWHFSTGQSQLLCLAREILRKNQILCCDEASTNLDPQTQYLMLTKIKEHFGKCTVITVAHRVESVIDCDKILVIEAGQVVDYGTPFDLINKKGPFHSLVMLLGRKSADKILSRIANENSRRKKLKRVNSHGIKGEETVKPGLKSQKSSYKSILSWLS